MIPECFLNILASEYSDDDFQQSTIINSQPQHSCQTMWIENVSNLDGGFNKTRKVRTSMSCWNKNKLTIFTYLIMAIRKGSRIEMKAKAAIKGNVLEATGKYTWDINWDDGIARAPYKSQQLKEVTDATGEPSSIPVIQGKFCIYRRLVVDHQLSSNVISLFSPFRRRRKPPILHHPGLC
jgi:hypothetical protein